MEEANIVAQAENRRDSSAEKLCLESRLLEDDVGYENPRENRYVPSNRGEGTAPLFVIAPKDVFILSKETAVIETRIYCTPKPIVRWYKNGHLITTAQFPRYKKHHHIPETYQLEIPNASSSDMAEYTCTARNCYGSITASARLRIIDLETERYPKFLKRLTRTEILAEQNGHLSVRVTGVPKPNVEWYKDAKLLKETKESRHIEMCHKEPCMYVLRLRNAVPDDTGVYTCRAENGSGATSTSAMVYVDKAENLKKKWSDEVAGRKLEKGECPDGWNDREMQNYMYRLKLANYHMKHRTESAGYYNLF